jgi:hypothetical protein
LIAETVGSVCQTVRKEKLWPSGLGEPDFLLHGFDPKVENAHIRRQSYLGTLRLWVLDSDNDK